MHTPLESREKSSDRNRINILWKKHRQITGSTLLSQGKTFIEEEVFDNAREKKSKGNHFSVNYSFKYYMKTRRKKQEEFL